MSEDNLNAVRFVGKLAEALDKPVDDYIDVQADGVVVDLESLIHDFFKAFRADVCE
jgi:hypothetical protein